MSINTRGILISLAMLAGIAVGIVILSAAFQERDMRTQEQDQRRD